MPPQQSLLAASFFQIFSNLWDFVPYTVSANHNVLLWPKAAMSFFQSKAANVLNQKCKVSRKAFVFLEILSCLVISTHDRKPMLSRKSLK